MKNKDRIEFENYVYCEIAFNAIDNVIPNDSEIFDRKEVAIVRDKILKWRNELNKKSESKKEQ